MAAALPSGTVTFLFTDIEGSTQLLRQLGDTYAAALLEHQRLLRQAWAEHGGVEVDTAGDGFFVAFPTAPAAVAAAAAATRSLAEHSWPEGTTLHVRMGLHTGSPQLLGDRYVGLDVHRAAHIAAAGHGGQILLSPTTRELVAHNLPLGVTLRDLGTYQLKDFPEPDHLYQLVLPGLPDTFPSLKTLDRPPHELPPRAPGFVGRDADIATLTTALRSGQAVAIVGMGGLGKSSLAAEVVHALALGPTTFLGGIAWVRCDERTGMEGLSWILDQLLAAWEVQLAAETTARIASTEEALTLRERALQKRLRPTPAHDVVPSLVLLDNVEAALPLDRLLQTLQSIGVTPLLTTRSEPASAAVEIFRLGMLAMESSCQLFATRFRSRGGVWSAENDTEAAEVIVQALGYLPLAIELAAARAGRNQIPSAELAQELDAPGILTRLSDPLQPSASARYSLGKTLSTLAPTQRRQFAVLGLPEGADWPQPLIEDLCTMAYADVGTTAPQKEQAAPVAGPSGLDALIAYSLVGQVASSEPGGRRIRLHPLVRELAREEWGMLPLEIQNVALDRLMHGVHDWVTAHREDITVLAQDTDLTAGALRHAYVRRVALPLVIPTIFAFENFVFLHNIALDMELRRLCLECARLLGDRDNEVEALVGLGVLSSYMQQRDEERRYLGEALALARAAGKLEALANVLAMLASAAIDVGLLEEARPYYEEVRAVIETFGEEQLSSRVQGNLGRAAGALGYFDEGIALTEKALSGYRAKGDSVGEASCLNNVADLYMLKGDIDTARSRTEEELALFRILGSFGAAGAALDRLGELAMATGDLAPAATFFGQALREMESGMDDQLVAPVQVHVRGNLAVLRGEIACVGGDLRESAEAYREAAAIFASVPPAVWHLQPRYVEFPRSRLEKLGPEA